MGVLGDIANKANQGSDQEERVSSGGSRYSKSGCYTTIIKMAKVDIAQTGAVAIAVELEDAEGNKAFIKEWIQSGAKTDEEKAKGKLEYSTFYMDKDGNQVNLPGLTKIKNLNFLINGIHGLPDSEPKQIKEYDWDAKQDVLVNKDVVTSWIDKPVGICVQITMEDKYNDEGNFVERPIDRKSTRLNSSHRCISYAVFCLKKKKPKYMHTRDQQHKWTTEELL